MNYVEVVKSFFLGIIIGLVLQPTVEAALGERVPSVLASGAIGLVIGLVTEWLTSLLPIRLARVYTYFAINSLIAVVATLLVMVVLVSLTRGLSPEGWDPVPVVAIVVGIVVVANVVDFAFFYRARARLRRVQDAVEAQQEVG